MVAGVWNGLEVAGGGCWVVAEELGLLAHGSKVTVLVPLSLRPSRSEEPEGCMEEERGGH